MKKKTLTIILALCVAFAMTACGGNTETIEEETAAAEESAAKAKGNVCYWLYVL